MPVKRLFLSMTGRRIDRIALGQRARRAILQRFARVALRHTGHGGAAALFTIQPLDMKAYCNAHLDVVLNAVPAQ